ncbi:Embryonic flower 2 [Zea mays]|uniref:Embryonic flower 2 n=1 Tax=Zea mays TaxID=4577 RepID=A0A1D6I1P7_MAIZE|nr:Embryonic flower 2 [Zea mays]
MPGLPLPQSLNQNIGCEYAYPGSTGQAFRQQLRTALSPDEKLTAEKDLALYCKPVELYNIIQRRAMKNPLFIQRCLLYNIHARRKKRIQITISLSGSTNTELQTHYVFPLYVLLARPTSNLSLEGHSPIYRFSRVCLLTSFSEHGNKDNSEATFIIPDVKSLSTSRACNHDIIFISCGQVGQSNGEDNCSGNHVEDSSLQMLEGKCSWGKIPTNLLASSLESCVNLSLGHIVELASKVTMRPSFLEPKFLEQDSCLTFCSHKVDAVVRYASLATASPLDDMSLHHKFINSALGIHCHRMRYIHFSMELLENDFSFQFKCPKLLAKGSYKLQLCMSAQEAGARDMSLSPYSSYSYNDVPPSSLSDIIRLRSGNVLFNYKYYNNTMQETEGCLSCF